MIIALHIVAVVLMVLGIFMVMGLTPAQITQDMMNMLRPADKLRTMVSDVQARRRRGGLYGELQRIRNTMEATGRGQLFPLLITSVFGFAALGVAIGIIVKNIWLIPTLVVGLGAVPFFYMGSAVEFYEKTVREELETALSIITNAYIRTDDIVVAVEENLQFIKPPLRLTFERFVQDSVVMASTKEVIIRLRDRLDDLVFYEWCTTLLQCQDDRTLKENLHPIVSKLTDIRLINTQVAAIISSAKTEYFAIIGFIFGSIPLLGVLVPGSLEILTGTPFGKFLVGAVSAVMLFTYFRLRKVTKPVDFSTK